MTSQTFTQYDEVFVILRVRPASDHQRTPESTIGLVKALWSAAEAETEVLRLNQSPSPPGTQYLWKAARLERRSRPAASV